MLKISLFTRQSLPLVVEPAPDDAGAADAFSLVSHGRTPFKGPRKILVAMS